MTSSLQVQDTTAATNIASNETNDVVNTISLQSILEADYDTDDDAGIKNGISMLQKQGKQ